MPLQEPARRARRLMDGAYATPITLDALSREAALSPYHLIRQFRRHYRQTPHQYLIQVRITRAKELLSTTDLSITEICAAVGFESLGSFSALFRRVAGITPSAYRQYGQSIQHSAYIPLCICLMHDLPEAHDS